MWLTKRRSANAIEQAAGYKSCLMIQIVVQALLFAQRADFWRLEESVELLEQRLLVDLSGDLFAQVDVVRTRLHRNRFEEGVNVLRTSGGTSVAAEIVGQVWNDEHLIIPRPYFPD